MLKKIIRNNLDDFVLCGGVIGGVFLATQLIIAGVMVFIKPDTSLLVSGALLPVLAGFMVVLVSVSHVGISFVMALQYGQTRLRALGLMLGLVGMESLFSMGLAGALTALERLFAPMLWQSLTGAQAVAVGRESAVSPPPGTEALNLLSIENFSFDWTLFILIGLGCMALGVIAGAVVQRFGSKGAIFLWVIWFSICLLPQLLPWKQYTITDWLLPLGAISLVVGVIWSVWSLLHATVKS